MNREVKITVRILADTWIFLKQIFSYLQKKEYLCIKFDIMKGLFSNLFYFLF